MGDSEASLRRPQKFSCFLCLYRKYRNSGLPIRAVMTPTGRPPGSSLTKGAKTGDYAAVTAKAQEFVKAVAAARA